VEADRLRPRRLPEHVVLEDPNTAVAGELCGEAPGPFGEHLGRDDVVGLPRVAELAGAVVRISSRNPVHLVGTDACLVFTVEERQVASAEELESALRHEALLDDEEAVSLERLDLLAGERFDQERGLVFSGS
jgi:hypothetical protein